MPCKIKDILDKKKTTLSFEIFPPKTMANMQSVIDTAKALSSLKPDFISITYGAGGSTRGETVSLAKTVEDCGTTALAHLTCIGQDESELDRTILELKKNNICNVLALRGDKPQGQELSSATIRGFKHASDLVAKLVPQGFCVGGACYPEGHPESQSRISDIECLHYKVDAGVSFLTTQLFFDNDMFYTFKYQLEKVGIKTPVLAGIMPITNPKQIHKMIELSDAYIPKKLLVLCERYRERPLALKQAGIAYATEQIIDLLTCGVRGIHIYTTNKSDIAKSIVNNISDILE